MAVRKSVAAVIAIPAERQELTTAFIALKDERSELDGRSTYDKYVSLHVAAMNRFTLSPQDANSRTRRNSAHRGPAFLPWHREFLYRLERDLQRVAELAHTVWLYIALLSWQPVCQSLFVQGLL